MFSTHIKSGNLKLRDKVLNVSNQFFIELSNLIGSKINNIVIIKETYFSNKLFSVNLCTTCSFNFSSNKGTPNTQSNKTNSSKLSFPFNLTLFEDTFLGSLVTVLLKLDLKVTVGEGRGSDSDLRESPDSFISRTLPNFFRNTRYPQTIVNPTRSFKDLTCG